jgi:hypothetical protein
MVKLMLEDEPQPGAQSVVNGAIGNLDDLTQLPRTYLTDLLQRVISHLPEEGPHLLEIR